MSGDLDQELADALDQVEEASSRREAGPDQRKTTKRKAQSEKKQLHSPRQRLLNNGYSSGGNLSILPKEVVAYVLGYVTASDLTSLSQTCHDYRQLAQDNDLWRGLYSARWGEKEEVISKLQDATSWKGLYMERDARHITETRERIHGPLQEIYLQVEVGKRSSIIAPRHLKPSRLSDTALWGRISRWRGSRGLLKCPNPHLGSKHTECPRKGPYAALEGGLFMCESCGWAHLCGEGCSERLVDEPSELLVCPVSGRCFDRMLVDWEEDGRDAGDQEAACDFGLAGHWGRAYADGYNCASEEELKYRFGVAS